MKKILSAAVLIALITASLVSPASATRDTEDSDHVCAVEDTSGLFDETTYIYIVLSPKAAYFLSEVNNENWDLTKDGAICNELSSTNNHFWLNTISYTYWGQCGDDDELDNIHKADGCSYINDETNMDAFRTIEVSDLEAAANGELSCIDMDLFVEESCVAEYDFVAKDGTYS